MEIKTVPSEVQTMYKLDELNNKKLLAQAIYKHLDFKRDIAVEKLMQVDFCKNNFSPITLKKYISNVSKYVKTGERVPTTPTYIYNIVDELMARKYPRLRPSEQDRISTKRGRPMKSTSSKTQANTQEELVITTNQIKMQPSQDTRQTTINFLKEEITHLQELKNKQEQQLAETSAQVQAIESTLKVLGV